MNKSELLEAYKALTQCIDKYIDTYKIRYSSSELAPSTYDAMVKYRETFGEYLVYNEGDHGFLGKEYNIKFRACHDHGHYTLGLNFSVSDEIELSNHSMYEFRTIAKDLGYSAEIADNVTKIIDCEVREQRLYYRDSGEYVRDQKQFVMSRLIVKY